MNVALTGASGFIGAFTAHTLRRAGHRVTALVRSSSQREHIAASVDRYVEGDQSDPGIWPELLEGAEAVIHNSADWEALRSGDLRRHLESNVVGSIALLEAARRAGVRRFVFISSVATHHEILPRWGGRIEEDHPLRPASLYGAYKAAVEDHLWMARFSWGMETVALRPCGVYGVEPVRLERSIAHKQVRRLLDGQRVTLEEFKGGGKWVHVEDVAAAIVASIERPGAAGWVFNLADCYAKHTLFARFAAELLDLPADRVELDESPPAKNMFDKTATREVLGVALDRGEEGLRAYVKQLIAAIREREPSVRG